MPGPLLGNCTKAHMKNNHMHAWNSCRICPGRRMSVVWLVWVQSDHHHPARLWNLLTKSSVTAVGTSDGQDQARVGGSLKYQNLRCDCQCEYHQIQIWGSVTCPRRSVFFRGYRRPGRMDRCGFPPGFAVDTPTRMMDRDRCSVWRSTGRPVHRMLFLVVAAVWVVHCWEEVGKSGVVVFSQPRAPVN